jgi:hypothetical protein
MKHYSAIKKNEILSFAGKWMELEVSMLNKIRQSVKYKKHMCSLTCRSKEKARQNKVKSKTKIMKSRGSLLGS